MSPRDKSDKKRKVGSPLVSVSDECESNLLAPSLPSGAEAKEPTGSSTTEQTSSSQEKCDKQHIAKRTRIDDERLQTLEMNTAAPVASYSYPAKVTGNYPGENAIFASSKCVRIQEFCKVDKTLVCRGFWEYIGMVGRIHLPRRFGKTYNLSIMRLFFSSSLELDETQGIPDDVIGGGVADLSVADICWKKREWLFRNSILKKKDPRFFKQHFGKHPVIFLSFSRCIGPSLADFLKQLCDVMIQGYNDWICDFEGSDTELSEDVSGAKQELDNIIRTFNGSRSNPAHILGSTYLAQDIFENLSTLIRDHFNRCYILLADDYDVPFITVSQSDWPADQQRNTLIALKILFAFMFKDSMSLEKGLMAGVLPICLGDIGSGTNHHDVTTVITEQNDLDLIALLGSPTYPLCSVDELVNSFGFNHKEVRAIAAVALAPYDYSHKQIDEVIQKIRQWYDGYQLYRFGGKYNPWSVCFYLKHLVQSILDEKSFSDADVSMLIESSDQDYWDSTGYPDLIKRQLELHPS
ncbi:hypothetical protein LPJ72_006227, partial [Coemansia sp. Benny D160-2]